MKIELTEDEMAALTLLKRTGVPVLEAAQVACAAIRSCRGSITRVQKCLAAGAEELKQREKTVSFERAVAEALEVRQGRRIRTLYDFRYITRRFMKRCPGLAKRRVRSVTPQECLKYIEMAFDTPRQRQKARLILSGVFSTAVKCGWCCCNPVMQVEAPRVQETPVPILNKDEIRRLNYAAEEYDGGSCAAAVAMMLYAGIRPHEVCRLTWGDVDLGNRAVYIQARHSKTGGARRVTIYKPLLVILRRHQRGAGVGICPPAWLQHWRQLRRAAGWIGERRWHQDALRHTYASYHLSYFRSYAELQCEIGHRDATLLRTRYVDQREVVNAHDFWQAKPRRSHKS